MPNPIFPIDGNAGYTITSSYGVRTNPTNPTKVVKKFHDGQIPRLRRKRLYYKPHLAKEINKISN